MKRLVAVVVLMLVCGNVFAAGFMWPMKRDRDVMVCVLERKLAKAESTAGLEGSIGPISKTLVYVKGLVEGDHNCKSGGEMLVDACPQTNDECLG